MDKSSESPRISRRDLLKGVVVGTAVGTAAGIGAAAEIFTGIGGNNQPKPSETPVTSSTVVPGPQARMTEIVAPTSAPIPTKSAK